LKKDGGQYLARRRFPPRRGNENCNACARRDLAVNQWNEVMENALDSYATLIDVIRRRRSVRRFAPGRAVDRSVLLNIAEAARAGLPQVQILNVLTSLSSMIWRCASGSKSFWRSRIG
jgi:hypothetical protein